MTHRRIRKFNTRVTYPEQNLNNDLCQSVVAKDTFIFLRGQVSQDLETRESMNIGDPGGKTAKAMRNIQLLLKESGSKLEHI